MKTFPETYSIEWHKECLRNMMVYLNSQTKVLDNQRWLVDNLTKEVGKRRMQIERAEKEGEPKFNHDNFKV